jgi:endoglucanase
MRRASFLLLFLLTSGAILYSAQQVSIIKIDQLGYRSGGEKLAIVSWPSERRVEKPFSTMNSSTSFYLKQGATTLYTGKLLGPKDDKNSGDTVFHADFSEYNQPGEELYIEVPGLTRSDKFALSEHPYRKGLYLGMRGYYYQRCGIELAAKHAGEWTRGACHLGDGLYYFKEEGAGSKKSVGGWHDAGDYGKKMMTAGPTVLILLSLCELFPDKLDSLGLKIPESGNGVPDILNEIRYELEWMLTMQEANGAVHHELIPLKFQFSTPQGTNPDRYLWRLTSFATGDYAGAMAIAARLYRRYDAGFADSCLAAAELAWGFLEANPGVVPPGGIKPKPPNPQTLGYQDDDDSDERFWAAAELYRTTGNDSYQDYVRANVTDYLLVPGWRNVRSHGAITYVYAVHANVDRQLQERLKQQLIGLADRELAKIEANAYKIGLKGYWWGSNSAIMSQAMTLIHAYELCGEKRYLAGAEEQLHYILGRNSLDVCFLSGATDKSVKQIHNSWQSHAGFDQAIPGLLSGGPNAAFQDHIIKRELPRSTSPAKCFVDIQGCYSCNENDIHYSAPFVFTAGYFHFMR